MGPQDLVQVLKTLSGSTPAHVLAGIGEDAAVVRLREDLAIVQTVDLITPVLDDPTAFGEVAAANALGDIYAMGAVPLFALNIVAYPARLLPTRALAEILAGGAAKAAEAGAAVIGGHSLDDASPKYGMAVTGVVHPERVVRKSGARPGDRLILTKPLGVGVLTTALTQGVADPPVADAVGAVMRQLNREAAEAMQAVGVHACTDVTGFGLLGHLREIADHSQVAARVAWGRVPVLAGAAAWVQAGAVSQGTRNNLRFLQDQVRWGDGLPAEARTLLCDAQTSGGLLIAVAADRAEVLGATLAARGVDAVDIGAIVAGPAGQLEVDP